jgi:hypothetical protein
MSLPSKTGVFHPAFSPWLADPEQLSRTLVGNEEIIRDFLARLAAMDKGSSANHVLLVGPRGIGKTHLLCLTGHYVSRRLPVPENWAFSASDWSCVLFTEEEYAGQNSLANFLLTLFEKLSEAMPGESRLCLPSDLAGKPDKVVVECCFETLRGLHEKTDKRLLVLVDNLQKILQQWTTEEHHQFRKFLSAGRFVVILGSAPSVFREVLDQKAALHDFFEIRILSELSSDQVMELLARRFQEDQRADEFNSRREELARKVSAIEVLTGGNPRLILFLYQIATGSTFWEIETALRMLLEELREYFVRRFDELPDQARKILDTIAQMPGPATPSEIAAAARVRPQLVNAQLQRLKSNHLVRQIKMKRQRATRYDITERLFRIWRQTATVAGRQCFKFLADFLRLYFTPDEVQSLYHQHVAGLSLSMDTAREEILRHVEELFYFQTGGEGKVRYDAFTCRIECLRKLGETRWAEEEARYFEGESSKLSDKAGIIEACKQELSLHLDAGHLAEALNDLKKLLQAHAYKEALAGAETFLQSDSDSRIAWMYLAMACNGLGNYRCLLEALRNAAGTDQPTPETLRMVSLALSYLGQNEEASPTAEQAIDLDSSNPESWITLDIAVDSLGNMDDALQTFGKMAETATPTKLTLTLTLRPDLNRVDEALQAVKQVNFPFREGSADSPTLERALETTRKAIEFGKFLTELLRLDSTSVKIEDPEGRFPSAAEIREFMGMWWFVRSKVSDALGKKDESLLAAEQGVALDPTNAVAWMWLGLLTISSGKYERASEAFRKAIEIGKPTSELCLLQSAALASLDRFEEARQVAEQAVFLDSTNRWAWKWLGIVQSKRGNYDRALEAFRNAAEPDKPSAELWRHQSAAFRRLNRFDEAVQAAEQATVLAPENPDAWLELAWAFGLQGQLSEALSSVERAAACGAAERDFRHSRGDIHLLAGQYEEALRELEIGLKQNSDDWDLMADSRIAKACLGELGPLMEALPTQLIMANIPPGSDLAIGQYLRDVAMNALRRSETSVPRGLWNALLSLESYHGFEWYGPLCGDFLRQLLNISPGHFVEYADQLSERVRNDRVLSLLDPFLQAAAFLRTKDVSILERLFPEVRELVLDIVRRVSPGLVTQLRLKAEH